MYLKKTKLAAGFLRCDGSFDVLSLCDGPPGKWTAGDVVDTRRAQQKYIVRDRRGSEVGETQALISEVEFPPPGSSRRKKKRKKEQSSLFYLCGPPAGSPFFPSVRPSVPPSVSAS